MSLSSASDKQQDRLDYFAAHAPQLLTDASIDMLIKDDEQRRRAVRTRLQVRCDLAWEYARTMVAREKR